MHELLLISNTEMDRGRGRAVLAGARPVRADRSGGVLPGEGRLHPRGQEGLRRLRRPLRVPGVRAGPRRAVRHLGRAVRARTAQAEEACRLVRAGSARIVSVPCDSDHSGSAPMTIAPARTPTSSIRRPRRHPDRHRRPRGPRRRAPGCRRRWRPSAGSTAGAGPARGRRRRVHGRPAPTWPASAEALDRAGVSGHRPAGRRGHHVRRVRGAGRGPTRRRTARPRPTPATWLWLLHDDGAPTARGAATGCSTRPGARPRSRSPAPSSPPGPTTAACSRSAAPVTRTGRRAGGPLRGEPDQGQHDHRTDVLGRRAARACSCAATSSPPSAASNRPSPPHAEDVDLCWRAHLAGHRVVVVPGRRVREAAATRG